MSKRLERGDKMKIRGIRKRWLLNSVGVVLLILILAVGAFATTLWNYYYTSTEDDLSRKASSTASRAACSRCPSGRFSTCLVIW